MGGVIGFGDAEEQIWYCAGWCYRAFLDSVMHYYAGETALIEEVEKDKYLHGVLFDDLIERDLALAHRLAEAFSVVAEAATRGERRALSPLAHLSESDRDQYRSAIAELLELILRERPRMPSSLGV